MKISKFKKGDRVTFKKRKGTVNRVMMQYHYPVYVNWDDRKQLTDISCYLEEELELIHEPIMDVDDLFGEIDI